jgi:hypothetical protein
LSKVPTKGPDVRERETIRFCEENEPLLEEAGDVARQRIFTQGASLIGHLSSDVTLASDRAVAAADRLAEAIKDTKVSPKEVAAREATYNKELRVFKRREATFKRLEELLNEAQPATVATVPIEKIAVSDLPLGMIRIEPPPEKGFFRKLRERFSR